METKTDNHNLRTKLNLRRYFIRKYNPGPINVVDCFSGSQEAIWSELRKEFPVSDYLALDMKEKRGRLKIDSLRYLQNQKWDHDVVDLDAYGSPWKHWLEVLKRGIPCTVFLTVGTSVFGRQDEASLRIAGITLPVPIGMHNGLAEIITSYCLTARSTNGILQIEIAEALNPNGTARYFGVRLDKQTK